MKEKLSLKYFWIKFLYFWLFMDHKNSFFFFITMTWNLTGIFTAENLSYFTKIFDFKVARSKRRKKKTENIKIPPTHHKYLFFFKRHRNRTKLSLQNEREIIVTSEIVWCFFFRKNSKNKWDVFGYFIKENNHSKHQKYEKY